MITCTFDGHGTCLETREHTYECSRDVDAANAWPIGSDVFSHLYVRALGNGGKPVRDGNNIVRVWYEPGELD